MQKYENAPIAINGRRFNAVIADSAIKRAIGLMFRKKIGKNRCMLFIFPDDARHEIWMYNMQFPIDVAWISRKLKVIDIKEGLEPCRSLIGCKSYAPKSGAKYVVEFDSGVTKKLGIKKGSVLRLPAKLQTIS